MWAGRCGHPSGDVHGSSRMYDALAMSFFCATKLSVVPPLAYGVARQYCLVLTVNPKTCTPDNFDL